MATDPDRPPCGCGGSPQPGQTVLKLAVVQEPRPPRPARTPGVPQNFSDFQVDPSSL